jgi:hypothetical protein
MLCLALTAGCGPDRGWEEPDLESRACGTREPIEVSPRSTSAYNFFAVGDDWTLVDLRAISETKGVSDAIIFDPCGEAEIDVYEASVVRPVGDGFVLCGGEQASWAPVREAVPVPLTPSTHCMHATLTDHGLLVQDAEGTLQLFASPDAEPREIAGDVAEHPPPSDEPLWFANGDLVWYVLNDRRLERLDLRSGERLVLAERVDTLLASPARDAIVWTRERDDEDPGTTTVHRIATGDMLELPGAVHGLWPGIVITGTWSDMTVLDIETRGTDTVRNPGWFWVVRADRGVRSLLVVTPSIHRRYANTIGRLNLDGEEFHPLTDAHISSTFAPDPHGDGVVVTEFVDDTPDDDEYEKERARIVRVSHTAATTLVDSATTGWALARDGRLLYQPISPDGTISRDLHVRNPDGTDRIFVRDAWLVAPYPWSAPYALEEFPDLEGDVLVNIASGDESSLWRMPFDTPP